MSVQRKSTSKTCQRCNVQHQKCDGQTPCSQCIKSKAQCEPQPAQFKFRSGQRQKSSLEFPRDQKWVAGDGGSKNQLHYVLVTPESDKQQESSLQNETPIRFSHAQEEQMQLTSATIARPSSSTSQTDTTQENSGPTMGTISRNLDPFSPRGHHIEQTRLNIENSPSVQHAPDPHPPMPSLIPLSRDKYPLGPLKGLPANFSLTAYTILEEACLIRHFTENLSAWFDTCDRDRHFELNVPERAMFCPVLRYAIYTASAGHLTRLTACRGSPSSVVVFDNIQLPGLTAESAMNYHDTCIKHLIEISKDPSKEYNEDVLTAATILRFYEQIDAISLGGDSETYLNAVQFIVETQRDESFYAVYKIQGPPRDHDVHAIPGISLRHSACLSALRQEIWSSFLNQRPFRLPISPNNIYDSFDDANDFTWTNRILIWCADLLRLCFGRERLTMTADEFYQKWQRLKEFEVKWETNKPPAFRPIHYEDSEPQAGKFFPTAWYMNASHVVGVQHIELSRILLAVSNPKLNVYRLGLGMRSSNYALEEELRSITRRLCGLALSNSKHPVVLVNAAVGISVCGEYFTSPMEQDAIVQLLADLEYHHAWPTQGIITSLRQAWKIQST